MDFGRESGNEALAEQLVLDYRHAELTERDRALCDFAVKLTLVPGDMRERDIAHLRRAGCSDDEIVIAVQVISYFNYINRVADALNVDPEDWMELPRDEWLERKGRDYI